MQTPQEYADTTAHVTSELDRLLGAIPESLALTSVVARWDDGDVPGPSHEAEHRVDPFAVHASQLFHLALVAVIEPAWPDGTEAEVRPAVLAVASVFLAHCARHGIERITSSAIEAAIDCATATVAHAHLAAA